MITPQNILRHELIGLTAKIRKASDKGLEGREGEVFDETRNMLTIKAGGKFVNVPKKGGVFLCRLAERWVEIDGNAIIARPEDRVKKKFG